MRKLSPKVIPLILNQSCSFGKIVKISSKLW